jgi:hypothetical protein
MNTMRNYLEEYNLSLTPVIERSVITESHSTYTITIPILVNGEDTGRFVVFRGEDAKKMMEQLGLDAEDVSK